MATLRYVLEVEAPISKVWRLWSGFVDLSKHFDVIEKASLDGNVLSVQYNSLIGRVADAQIQITESVEQRVLAFKGVDSEVAGSIALAPAGQNTVVTVVLSYDPPGARLGDIVSDLLKYPSKPIQEGLERYHRAMERT
ncbi:MAG: hypothetical protein R3E66_24795 [bacterium]